MDLGMADSDFMDSYTGTYNYTEMQNTKIAPPAPVAVIPDPVPSVEKSLLGPENTVTVCQFCRASIKTAVQYTTTSRTHMAGALWGILCCLCCVPYSSDSAKNSDHYCPNCNRYLGTYVK